ncbi:reprolysin-like metallopeptidase [uncultured Lacinutrix sp.]|uniref:reprolysin-like metallopeptidase n=1 Tax=uncultured Lacinutrix sp. TaxID=574032 RepID=UPI002632196B|nr:zinc-dependent metalloprotease family protein [uncultured Lacinutrix sp.]
MKKITFLIFGLLFSMSSSFAQSRTVDSKNMWTKTNESNLQKESKVHRSSQPTEFQLYALDIEKLKSTLKNAPMRGEIVARKSPVKVVFPNASGEFETFSIVETPVMEDELARKMPMIKAYAGQGVEDPSATIRFTVTQFGLHTMTLSGTKNSWYIDPFTEDRLSYIVYSKGSLGKDMQGFECLTDDDVDLPSLSGQSSQRPTNDDTLRTFRLAQSCTGEYGAIFAGSGSTAAQKANVQAQMAITMTRVNGIYERDLAVTMIFVANNDDIIFLNAATDDWTNEWNSQTAVTIDGAIGIANYDIGHNFNTTGGGNAGCLFCVCTGSATTNSQNGSQGTHKGRGYTGRADPTGDPFDVDYVAHEMGHQFGGYHTMNSCSRSGGTYNDGIGSEVEPASGSTIMGYAGICSTNVQNNSDAYFHFVNIADISDNLQNGASSTCAVETNIGNAAPTADAGIDLTIPISTPYALTGISTDADGTASHTFTWEQIDNEQRAQEAPQATYNNGPLTKSFEGTTNPTRYIPRLEDLRTSNGSTTWEVLSSVSRNINFALTVKDNNAAGGQTADDLKLLTTTTAAGPFIVTSQNTATTWAQGSSQTITWNVAGTTANGVNTANVDIFLSKDGGLSYPTVLATAVPNNGSANIIVPNGEATNCRVMVKGANHVFFNINTTDFVIAGSVAPTISYATTIGSIIEGSDCNFTDITVPLTIGQGPSQSATATFTVAGGDATNGVDFDIMTPSVTFAQGATASQDLVLRIYNDSFVEVDETITIDFGITTTGDAVLGNNSFVFTINNDDSGAPTSSSSQTLFDDDFSDGDASDWTIRDNNGVAADDWALAQESDWTTPFGIYTDYFLRSYSWNGQNYSPDNFVTSPVINIPDGASNINLRYFAGSGNDGNFFSENYEVYISTTAGSVANILAGTRLVDAVIPAAAGAYYDVVIPNSFANQPVYISFRHHDTTGEWVLGVDEVSITADIGVDIRTAVNTGTTNDSLNLSAAGTVYTADDSGELMLDVVNNNADDYGCTDVSVSRSGVNAQAYNGSVSPAFVTDKTFTITPANTIASGSVDITFYFTDAEIQGIEALGASRANLYAHREGSNDIVTLTNATFGTDVTLTGTFTGLDGTYYFGPEDAFRVRVSPKVVLQGAALNPNTGEESLMRDDLRTAFPLSLTSSPYSDGLTCDASVFNTTGVDAIVDWVFVELRDATTNTTVVASQSALLQRDGDVVGADGTSALTFNIPSNNYYVVIKHRNHLGIMSASTILLDATTRTVDFTNGTTTTFGTDAQTTFGMQPGISAMWAGDTNGDGQLNYSGALSDVPGIRSQVFNDPNNSVFGGPPVASYQSQGYYGTDVDMDGLTVYSGGTSDVSHIRNNIFNNPSNSVFGGPPTSTYLFVQQLPEGAN